MTSPIRVLVQARKIILNEKRFCLYDDPRFPARGIARIADGTVTMPENTPAKMFTLTGAVMRGVWILTDGGTWRTHQNVINAAMLPLYERVSFNHMRFLRFCDSMGREKCIRMLNEIIDL